MGTKEALGAICNIVGDASGAQIDMSLAEAVTFVSFLEAGTQTLTFEESQSGANSQNLAAVTRAHKGPGSGGTWTEIAQAAAATIVNADAANDCVVVTLRADQLSDGFNGIECTASGGTLFAFTHGLDDMRDPVNLLSPIF